MRLDFRGEYPPDWREIKDLVRAEAGNRCIRCLHPHDPFNDRFCDDQCRHEQRQVSWGVSGSALHQLMKLKSPQCRSLTVHHMDGDKANCVWWNLLALCQVCHLQVQAKVIPERPYLWEHKPWITPYVCGFYAHYYGQREITRAEAETTPEKWLALGQPWRYEATA